MKLEEWKCKVIEFRQGKEADSISVSLNKEMDISDVIEQIDKHKSNNIAIVHRNHQNPYDVRKAIELHHEMTLSEANIFRFTDFYYLTCYITCK